MSGHSAEKDAPCEGCLSGYDIGLLSSGIAYPHPDCPVHGDSWLPFDNQWSRDYVAAHPERFSHTRVLPPAETDSAS